MTLSGSKEHRDYQAPTIETLEDDYSGQGHKISPIKPSSPHDGNFQYEDISYQRSKENSAERKNNNQVQYFQTDRNKVEEERIAKILNSQLDEKSLGGSYNSLLYFKTTDEGQQKCFNSYDYYDDLIKDSKDCKFMPLNQKQGRFVSFSLL